MISALCAKGNHSYRKKNRFHITFWAGIPSLGPDWTVKAIICAMKRLHNAKENLTFSVSEFSSLLSLAEIQVENNKIDVSENDVAW